MSTSSVFRNFVCDIVYIRLQLLCAYALCLLMYNNFVLFLFFFFFIIIYLRLFCLSLCHSLYFLIISFAFNFLVFIVSLRASARLPNTNVRVVDLLNDDNCYLFWNFSMESKSIKFQICIYFSRLMVLFRFLFYISLGLL